MNGDIRRRRFSVRFWLSSGAVIVVAASLGAYVFLNAGRWLVREDPLQKADIVVVLSGGLPDRALAAAEVFRFSQAQVVWLTMPRQPAASMQQLDLPYSGEEQYNRMILIAKGVPPEKVRILERPIDNTEDELNAVLSELQARPGSVVIVVTSKSHTRRVRALWKIVSRGTLNARLLVRAAPQDGFDPDHWWRASNDALSVVREYLGLLNAWAGLPLHHAR
jgi:uncharacterized SAM-binding protein YcdF (DUF218 family)